MLLFFHKTPTLHTTVICDHVEDKNVDLPLKTIHNLLSDHSFFYRAKNNYKKHTFIGDSNAATDILKQVHLARNILFMNMLFDEVAIFATMFQITPISACSVKQPQNPVKLKAALKPLSWGAQR